MTAERNTYDEFVEHPRYGRGPRITGLNPKPFAKGVHLHWNSVTYKELKAAYEAEFGHYPGYDTDSYRRTRRIPNTAIPADLDRQASATIPVTHYFDLERACVDCKRPFIFFAQEQKHWYEELRFGLDSDCIRCVECRKKQQNVARQRETYEALFHTKRNIEQNVQMAEVCLSLMKADAFNSRRTETVRMLLNAIPQDAEIRQQPSFAELMRRLHAIEEARRP